MANNSTLPAARRRRRRLGDLRVAAVFILPATIGFLAFFLIPSIAGIWYSFTDYALFGPVRFVGFDNYVQLIHDPLFWNALLVTLEYVVINIGVQTVLALAIAVLMHRLTRSIVIRGIILTPYFVANVVVALVWFWIFDYSSGVANQILSAVGIHPVAFFGSQAWAIPPSRWSTAGASSGTPRCCSSPGCRRFPTSTTRRRLWTGPRRRACSAASPSRCCARSWPWFW